MLARRANTNRDNGKVCSGPGLVELPRTSINPCGTNVVRHPDGNEPGLAGKGREEHGKGEGGGGTRERGQGMGEVLCSLLAGDVIFVLCEDLISIIVTDHHHDPV